LGNPFLAQQGLIQMVRDFCDHSNAICDRCKLPDLVRDWRQNEFELDSSSVLLG
jgi:hypothetical protein